MSRRPALIAATAIALATSGGSATQAQDHPGGGAGGAALRPTTTTHAPLPASLSRYWLVPDAAAAPASGRGAETATARFARGARLIESGEFAAGLPLVTGANLTSTLLTSYVRYYQGVALLGLERASEAEAVFAALAGESLDGYLSEAVPLRWAEAALANDEPEQAAEILDELSDDDVTRVAEVLVRLGEAREAAGEREEALDVYYRVYYEFPLASQASDAQAGIERLQTASDIPPDRFSLELARAEQLFDARRWAQARAGYASLARVARNDDRELVALRLAECDYYLDRHRAARDALRSLLETSSREAEARFFPLSATRALGAHDTYVTLARGLVADHPRSSWAEETLNNLASHYIIVDRDADADRVFRDLVRRFPQSRYGDRAAWRIGWESYKNGRFLEAARTFAEAAAAYPRADYRPSWLYWAARSRDRIGERTAANVLYQIVASDYLNSYYGRLASAVLSDRGQPDPRPIVAISQGAPPAVPNEPAIRALTSIQLHDAALAEVQFAQQKWGDATALQATAAWIRHRRGLEENAANRFADVRGAITIMRRAYPQFMAAGGEELPPQILQVIFPLDYWPLIKKYSDAHGLDPYLMTALVAQESTFTADVRSSANAVGLMQLIPGTGRRYAARLGIRPFSEQLLTRPETNVRLGMRYFKDLMERFGGAHFALASYNAGEQRISRWIAERPGFARDEFIDDIPFPETQNYVKRILGTAEDYRRLYGGGILSHTGARD